MNEQELVRLVLAQFQGQRSSNPALIIDNHYYDQFELAALSTEARNQWGANTADYIERFIAACTVGKYSLLVQADSPPEVKVTPMPIDKWWVVTHEGGLVSGNGYALLRTAMSLEDI